MIFILSCCCWKRKKLHDVCLKLPWSSSSSSSKNLLLWSFIYNNCCQIQDSFILNFCAESWGPIQLLLIIYQNYFLSMTAAKAKAEGKMHQFWAVHSSILGCFKNHATFHFFNKNHIARCLKITEKVVSRLRAKRATFTFEWTK